MVKILVFDTETTGLPEKTHSTFNTQKAHERSLLSMSEFKRKGNLWSTVIDKYPHIIQMAYILYDTEKPDKSKIYNKRINIPETIEISVESQKIHGISHAKLNSMDAVSKAYIKDTLVEFMEDFKEADVIVGHNVDFDRRMVIAEILRSPDKNIEHVMELMKDENFECTQEITTPICNLKSQYEYIDPKTKIPKYIYKIKPTKLIEAYRHYFGYTPDGQYMHNAIYDVVVCLRVYCMSFPAGEAFDVCNHNEEIRDYILKVSPHNKDTCEETKKFMELHHSLKNSSSKHSLTNDHSSSSHHSSKKDHSSSHSLNHSSTKDHSSSKK